MCVESRFFELNLNRTRRRSRTADRLMSQWHIKDTETQTTLIEPSGLESIREMQALTVAFNRQIQVQVSNSI